MKVSYTAKNYSGESRGGEADIKNERDLVSQLRADGFTLTSFRIIESDDEKPKVKVKLLDRFFSISIADKMMFTRNLAVMISSGLPLSRAVKNITAQTKNKRFAGMLDKVFTDIQAGETFADSLAKYPGVFNELFVNMVRVGEASGNLEEVLDILALQIEKEHDLNSKVKGALTYPTVILVAMVGIGIIMLTYVLPKLLGVFKDMQVELPASTKFVIGISDAFRNHSFLIGGTFIVLVLGLKLSLRTGSGRRALGFIAINVPVIKNIVIKVNCARFSRIYSSLLKSGVPVMEALKILSNTLTNYYYKEAFIESMEQVQKGVNLSQVIAKNSKIFPVLVCQMVEVGEETGKTEQVLLKLAEFYEEEINQFTKNISSVIEPVLMIIIGSAVGFFAVSMLQPMYSIMDNIK